MHTIKSSPTVRLVASAILAAGVLLSAPQASAAVTYATGDLLVGFHTASGQGSGISFVFNLGPAVHYRDNAYTTPLVNDIGGILSSTFGANWFSRSDLYWGIAAVRRASGAGSADVVNGDPRNTLYLSRSASGAGLSEPWTLPSASTISSTATNISAAQGANGTLPDTVTGGFEGSLDAPGTFGFGTLQDEGSINNSWDEWNPIGGAAFQTLAGGIQGPFGGAGSQKFLDVYRMQGVSSASATPNDPIGQGRYVTTFSINESGIITTIPEPTGALLTALGLAIPVLRRRRQS
jgi:hypothetical protein